MVIEEINAIFQYSASKYVAERDKCISELNRIINGSSMEKDLEDRFEKLMKKLHESNGILETIQKQHKMIASAAVAENNTIQTSTPMPPKNNGKGKNA